MASGAYTWQELVSQPEIWQATIKRFAAQQAGLQDVLDQTPFERVVVVGCGSTHYLAQTVAAIIARCTDVPARAFPSSELWLFSDVAPTSGALLLAVSRSGTTTETLRALARFREISDGTVLAVTCYPESPLARQVDFVLSAPDAQEKSVAQTRSFTSMLLLTQMLAATMGEDGNDGNMFTRLHQLPGALHGLLERVGDLPRRLGEDLSIDRIFFLGGGPFYGLASEAMLKTKEMSLSQAEVYHPLEFRHGPMSMVTERTLLVLLASDTGLKEELRVLEDMQKLGARTLALVEDRAAFSDWQPDDLVELQSGLSEWERGTLYLPVIQRLAYHRAMIKGLNPDQPHNLTAVVEL
ncbi:MAG TPA: SIS domain-containing protein [Chloroflexi bacterium]|nr:SIS domain-containing protein [Chloroflexota bacterium]